jgi:hypothetical protein
MNYPIKIRSLAPIVIRSPFPRAWACLVVALFLMMPGVLWSPGESVQAYGRLTTTTYPSQGQSPSTPHPTPAATPTPTPTPAATPTPTPTPTPSPSPATGTICGRLRPASLDEILAVIPTLPTVRTFLDAPPAIAALAPDKQINWWNTVADGPAKQWFIIHERSRFDSACRDQAVEDGKQKEATVKFLTWFLGVWKGSKESLKQTSCREDSQKTEEDFKKAQEDFKKPGIKLCADDQQAIDIRHATLSPDAIHRQINLLNAYIGNLTVYLKYKYKDGDNEVTEQITAKTDKDGNFSKENIRANVTYLLSTDGDGRHTEREYRLEERERVKINLEIEDRPVSLLTRAVVGYQQAGAAATSYEQNYFFDLFVSQTLPFRQTIDPDFGEKWRSWGAIRAISVPQSGDVSIGDFIGSGANSFVAKVSELKLKDAARVFDYLGGVEFQFRRFAKNYNLLPSFDGHTKQKFALSLIAGGGFVTPTNPLETQPKVYELTEQIKTEFNRTDQNGKLINPQLAEAIKGKQHIAFLSNDRDRFFRQYYAGFRVQTFFFNRYNVPLQRFPAQFDFTIGQNEYVTGGRLRGAVLRLDAYYPLPYDKMNFINLFGMAVFKPARVRETTPLLLKEALIQNPSGSTPATSPVLPTDPTVGLIPVGQFNRDYYRVGVGVDLPSLLKKIVKP